MHRAHETMLRGSVPPDFRFRSAIPRMAELCKSRGSEIPLMRILESDRLEQLPRELAPDQGKRSSAPRIVPRSRHDAQKPSPDLEPEKIGSADPKLIVSEHCNPQDKELPTPYAIANTRRRNVFVTDELDPLTDHTVRVTDPT